MSTARSPTPSATATGPAFNAAFREAGLDWHWDEALYGELLAVTGGKERIAHYVSRHWPANSRNCRTYAERVAALHKAKTRHYTQLAATGAIPLRPGVARLLQEARAAGLRLAVATTTTPENVSALLVPALGPDAMAWFEVIGAGDVVPAKKPAPDIYRWVLERLGLPASACLAFEDSENGLKASLGAGLATDRHPLRLHPRPGFQRRRGRPRQPGGAGLIRPPDMVVRRAAPV
jgi:beta-phosphoglucomutase-like phosphatase (HAD superfamily)